MRGTPPTRTWTRKRWLKLVLLFVAASLCAFGLMAPKNEQFGAGQRRVPFGIDGESAIGYRLLVETLRQRGYRVRTATGSENVPQQAEGASSIILLEPTIDDLEELSSLRYSTRGDRHSILIALPFLRGRQDPQGTASIDRQWAIDQDEVLELLTELNTSWTVFAFEGRGIWSSEVNPTALLRNPPGPYALRFRDVRGQDRPIRFQVPEEALALQSVRVKDDLSLISLDSQGSLLFEADSLSGFASNLKRPRLAVLTDPGWLMNYEIHREPTQLILDRVCDELFLANSEILVCSFAHKSYSHPSFWERFLEPPLRNLLLYLCFLFLVFVLAGFLRLPPLPKKTTSPSTALNLSGVELRAKSEGLALVSSLNALLRVRASLSQNRKREEAGQFLLALKQFEQRVNSRSVKDADLVAEALELSTQILGHEPSRTENAKSLGQVRVKGVARRRPLAQNGEERPSQASGPIEKLIL